MRYSNRVCMVTGAGSGIGKAVAKQMAQEGGKVTVIDLNEQHGNQTVQEITSAKGDAIFAKCDVGNAADVKAAVQATARQVEEDRRRRQRCGDDDVQADSGAPGRGFG